MSSVLVIDNDEIIIELLRISLTEMGLTPLLATEVKTGEELLHKHIDDIVLLVLDQVLPDMNGTEAYVRFRESYPDLPVLFVSGFNAWDIASKISSKHKCSFLQKPFNMIDFKDAVKEAANSMTS